jgi:hypothetical protein
MNWYRATGIGMLFGALVLSGSAPAAAPPDLRGELARRAAQVGLTAEETAGIFKRADRIDALGLPVRPIFDRYLEGLAKGVPLIRIEAVVDQLETRLKDAAERVDAVFPRGRTTPDRTTLNRTTPDREGRLALIDHGAYALGVGVSANGIEQAMRLAAEAHQGPDAGVAPVLATGCLVAGGLKFDVSLDLVRTAWTHGYRGPELEKLGRDLGSLGREGEGPPPAVLDKVLGLIRSGADREMVFRNLDMMRGPGPSGPGYHPPGMGPGEDPSQMHGPGGPPENPGHMGPDGRHHPPPPPHGGGGGGHH